MSVLKTVGVLGAVSGIGLIGYYLLNKYKPTISKEQKAELQGKLYVLKDDKPEYRKIWSIIAKYGNDNLSGGNPNNDYLPLINKLLTEKPLVISARENDILKGALEDVYSKNGSSQERSVFSSLIGEDLKKWLGEQERIKNFDFEKKNSVNLVEQDFTNRAYSYKPFGFDNYVRWQRESEDFFRERPDPSGKDIRIVAYNCLELDRDIKKIQDRIVEQIKKEPNQARTRVLVWYKEILEDYFKFQGCRDKIEKQRLLDSAKSQTLFSIKAEDSVLGANQKNQNIYLGAGALVLVLSTGILLSTGKSSTPTSGSSKSLGILGNLVIVGGLAGMGYLIFKKPKAYKSQDELTELLNTK